MKQKRYNIKESEIDKSKIIRIEPVMRKEMSGIEFTPVLIIVIILLFTISN